MKLFITDYDGTLYNNDLEIKENNLFLKKLKNNDFKIVIATGRSYSSIKNQVSIYNIPYDYLICADGSIIYDKDGKIEKAFYMDNSIIKPFQNFYRNIKFEEIQFSYPDVYSNILRDDNSKLLGINICISTINYNEKIVNNFHKFSKKYSNYNFLDYKHPNYSYLCVKPKGITKSSSIKYLKDKYKVKENDIYVIGDSNNDYEMIKDFHGYCINNACQEILKIAKKQYQTVYELIIDIIS